MWQHVKLSKQIRPWDTLACCWDVKQLTNKQTSQHLCPSKLWTSCYVCSACQSICMFLLSDFGMARATGLQQSLQWNAMHGNMQASQGQLKPTSIFFSKTKSVRMMEWVIFVSHWETRHCESDNCASLIIWTLLGICNPAKVYFQVC